MLADDTRTRGGAGTTDERRRPPGQSEARANRLAAFAFLAPNVAFYTLFIVIPAVSGVVLGFFAWDLFTTPEWVGLDNYRRLFNDPRAASSLAHTAAFVGLGAIPTILLGFVLAVLLNWRVRSVPALRVLYLLPLAVSTAVAGVLWSALFSPNTGIINQVLGVLHIPEPAWFGSTTWALPALTIVIVWLSLPLAIILYLAGLQRVPPELDEAARLDGAGTWTRMWRITWPNVKSTTILVAVLQLLLFLATPFELALIVTSGGPLDSTTSLSLYAYKVAFEQGDIGYASVLSMSQFLAIVLIVGLGWAILWQRRKRA